MKICIYCIYFPTSNKYYVGQTNNLQGRMKRHLKSGLLVCKALWKYDDWQVSILHTCKTRDQANLLEIEEIRNFNSVAPNGYNFTAGGEGIEGYCHSAEAKEKMRGNKNSLGYKHTLGYKHSEETKEKIRQANLGNQKHLGYKHSEEVKQKIRRYKHSEEAKQKMRGRKCSVETKLKMQYSQIKRRLQELGN